MTLVDDLLPVINAARAIPGQLGLRPHTVAIVRVESSGEHTGDGTRTETVTAVTEAGGQPPRVKWLDDEQLALGQLPSGTIEVGPITPAHSGGGTELDLLTGVGLATGDVLLLRITGPNHPDGADYRISSVSADRALRYMLQGVPVGAQPA